MMELAVNNALREVILYVDDEDMARKYFNRSLSREYEVLTAPDADAAIAMLHDENLRIGVLVTDYRMPGRDGGNLLRQVEREFPHVVRIVVTAYAEREVLLDAVNSGEVFRILEKPLNLNEVRAALRMACDLSRERQARRQRLAVMDETLAFLAHELNTPLAAIANFSGGVYDRAAGECVTPQHLEDIGKAAQAMERNARYCLSLLSTFVRSVREAGPQEAGLAEGSAQQMIAALLDSYPLTPAQRASIRVEVLQDFPVLALPDCVALVLSSLLANALNAVRDQAAPEICFTVSRGECPAIRIADNGCGIPPQIQARLLHDPVTTHENASGKGWGMIFCKRIMQSFGGGIRVHSVPGEGASVTLSFPAV